MIRPALGFAITFQANVKGGPGHPAGLATDLLFGGRDTGLQEALGVADGSLCGMGS